MVEKKRAGFGVRTKRYWARSWQLWAMLFPAMLYIFVFCYVPMYGVQLAFREYSFTAGFTGGKWVGLKYFRQYFESPMFFTTLKNTFVIAFTSILVGFPAPIILALLLNELTSKRFQKGIQLVAYLPHFISIIVVCGLISKFTSDNGIINSFLALFGFEKTSLLNVPKYFVPIYVISGIWTDMGWSSIIYFAALTGIDQSLYEAAVVEGANRWQQTLNITLPGILSTIIVMLILQIGNLLNLGYEKIILLYNPITYETADVISTYVYRKGILEGSFSFSTAVGLFNSVVSFILLIGANKISRKIGEGSLW